MDTKNFPTTYVSGPSWDSYGFFNDDSEWVCGYQEMFSPKWQLPLSSKLRQKADLLEIAPAN